MAQRKTKKKDLKLNQAGMEGNLVKALSHPLRARALAIFNERVTSPAELARWAKLSLDAKNGISIAGLRMQNDASMTALEAGTFDARDDRHLSCAPITVTRRAGSN